MPYANKAEHKAYIRRRYHERRGALVWLLGEACVRCNGTNRLEFDHIDPSKKEFYMASRMHSAPWEQLMSEISKCQLLCYSCHKVKTKEARIQCESGTKHCYICKTTKLESEFWCKQSECKTCKNARNNEWRHRTGIRGKRKNRVVENG